MANRHEDNLPEVVPDTSPQALTFVEAYERRGLDDGEQKYTVIYDKDTPKIVTSAPFVGDGGTPTTPAPAYRPPVVGATGGAGSVGDDVEDMGKEAGALAAEKGGPKILGFKRRTFIIVLLIAVIIIAAGVGGGIGGFQAAAAKQKANSKAETMDSAEVVEEASSPSPTAGSDTDEESDAVSSADNSSAGESSDETTTTSSPAPPKPTSGGSSGGGASTGDTTDDDDDDKDEDTDDDDDNSDRPKPGFEFRGWKSTSFKGQVTEIIATTGFLDLPFDVKSYKWQPKGTDCCITMCQGKKKDVGWRCTSFDREESTAKFGRIFIGCGAEASQDSSRCS